MFYHQKCDSRSINFCLAGIITDLDSHNENTLNKRICKNRFEEKLTNE